MRTTIEIIIANQENQSCTVDELRLALEALRIIHHIEHEELNKLIDVVRTDRPSAKMRADFATSGISFIPANDAGRRQYWSSVYLPRLRAQGNHRPSRHDDLPARLSVPVLPVPEW